MDSLLPQTTLPLIFYVRVLGPSGVPLCCRETGLPGIQIMSESCSLGWRMVSRSKSVGCSPGKEKLICAGVLGEKPPWLWRENMAFDLLSCLKGTWVRKLRGWQRLNPSPFFLPLSCLKGGGSKEPTWITFKNTPERSLVNYLGLCCLYLTNDRAGHRFNYLLWHIHLWQ